MTTRELPDKIKQLDVLAGQDIAGSLVKDSIYNFSYAEDAPNQPVVGLFMPRTSLSYQDAALFPVMDQNLPEGYLFQRIREMFPKQALTPMHLLALAGSKTKTYPLTDEMIQFGTQVCGVTRPLEVLERIAQALLETLQEYKTDTRIPDGLIVQMGAAWEKGMPSRTRGTSLVASVGEGTANQV